MTTARKSVLTPPSSMGAAPEPIVLLDIFQFEQALGWRIFPAQPGLRIGPAGRDHQAVLIAAESLVGVAGRAVGQAAVAAEPCPIGRSLWSASAKEGLAASRTHNRPHFLRNVATQQHEQAGATGNDVYRVRRGHPSRDATPNSTGEGNGAPPSMPRQLAPRRRVPLALCLVPPPVPSLAVVGHGGMVAWAAGGVRRPARWCRLASWGGC